MKAFNLEGHSKSYESILATYESAKKKLEEQNKKDKEALKKRKDAQHKMLGSVIAGIQPLTLNLEKDEAEIILKAVFNTQEFNEAYNRIEEEYQKKKELEQAEKAVNQKTEYSGDSFHDTGLEDDNSEDNYYEDDDIDYDEAEDNEDYVIDIDEEENE